MGPALAASALLLAAKNGEGWIFLINGISFAAIIIGLFFVRAQYKAPIVPRTRSMLEEFREGAQYLFKNSSVGLIVIIAATLGIFAFPIIQQLPVVSTNILSQVGDTKSAIDLRNSMLYTAQGVGALVAAFSIAMNNSARWRGLRLIAGEAAFILGMIAMPFLHSLWPTIIVITLMGWGSVTQLATMNTLIQLQVPDTLRGRVFSIYLWALQGVAPFGSLLVGWMTQELNLATTALICGLTSLVIIGGIQLFRPNVRQIDGTGGLTQD